MELVFVTDSRFIKAIDGKIYSVNGLSTNTLWKRYLSVFDNIVVMARVRVDYSYKIDCNFLAVNDKVSFIELPYYVGPLQMCRVYFTLKRAIKENIVEGRAYLCLWGTITDIAYRELLKRKIPYAVEVVGDPYDVFAPKKFKHPLRPLIRYLSYYGLRNNVRNSSATLYVTEKTLQHRYPASNNTFQTSASNVELTNDCLASQPKIMTVKNQYNLISVGSLAQMYKSPDILLKAISLLKNQGISTKLTWLGDGKFKHEMIRLSEDLGIKEQVEFVGTVSSGEEVRKYLNEADLFILASRTEGLPRAIIEAMAMGLPCIGTHVAESPNY